MRFTYRISARGSPGVCLSRLGILPRAFSGENSALRTFVCGLFRAVRLFNRTEKQAYTKERSVEIETELRDAECPINGYLITEVLVSVAFTGGETSRREAPALCRC